MSVTNLSFLSFSSPSFSKIKFLFNFHPLFPTFPNCVDFEECGTQEFVVLLCFVFLCLLLLLLLLLFATCAEWIQIVTNGAVCDFEQPSFGQFHSSLVRVNKITGLDNWSFHSYRLLLEWSSSKQEGEMKWRRVLMISLLETYSLLHCYNWFIHLLGPELLDMPCVDPESSHTILISVSGIEDRSSDRNWTGFQIVFTLHSHCSYFNLCCTLLCL